MFSLVLVKVDSMDYATPALKRAVESHSPWPQTKVIRVDPLNDAFLSETDGIMTQLSGCRGRTNVIVDLDSQYPHQLRIAEEAISDELIEVAYQLRQPIVFWMPAPLTELQRTVNGIGGLRPEYQRVHRSTATQRLVFIAWRNGFINEDGSFSGRRGTEGETDISVLFNQFAEFWEKHNQ